MKSGDEIVSEIEARYIRLKEELMKLDPSDNTMRIIRQTGMDTLIGLRLWIGE